MKKIILIAILFLNCLNIFAGGHSGNGTDMSEINILNSWHNLSNYLDKIVHSQDSRALKLEERNKILSILNLKSNDQAKLLFKSGLQNKELFKNNTLRFFTSKNVNSDIYINQDLIFKKIDNHVVSYSIADSVEFVLLILIERYQVNLSKDTLNQIHETISADVKFYNLAVYNRAEIGVEVSSFEKLSVSLTSEKNKIEITQKIIELSSCQSIESISIEHLSLMSISDVSESSVELRFFGDIVFKCLDKSFRGRLEISPVLFLHNYTKNNYSWYHDQNVKSEVKSFEVDLYNISRD